MALEGSTCQAGMMKSSRLLLHIVLRCVQGILRKAAMNQLGSNLSSGQCQIGNLNGTLIVIVSHGHHGHHASRDLQLNPAPNHRIRMDTWGVGKYPNFAKGSCPKLRIMKPARKCRTQCGFATKPFDQRALPFPTQPQRTSEPSLLGLQQQTRNHRAISFGSGWPLRPTRVDRFQVTSRSCSFGAL